MWCCTCSNKTSENVTQPSCSTASCLNVSPPKTLQWVSVLKNQVCNTAAVVTFTSIDSVVPFCLFLREAHLIPACSIARYGHFLVETSVYSYFYEKQTPEMYSILFKFSRLVLSVGETTDHCSSTEGIQVLFAIVDLFIYLSIYFLSPFRNKMLTAQAYLVFQFQAFLLMQFLT